VLLSAAFAFAAAGRAQAAPACAGGPVRVGDAIEGTPCADTIFVPPSVATVVGGGGDDTIVAVATTAEASCPEGCRLGVGSQTFEGGPGDDVVYGERGNDVLRGGEGNDRLYGGIGDDRLEGGPGADFLSGGFGADGLDGGPGDDYVRGDGTQDEIVDTGPGSDTDTLSYSTGIAPGFTRSLPEPHAGFPPSGGERGVYLDLAANLGDNGVAPNGGGVDEVEGSDFERIVGSPFADYIAGSKSGQTIYGGGGADVLIAAGGGGHLVGGADGDDCVGEATVSGCESTAASGPVAPRDPGKVSVGLIAGGETSESQLYLLGSSGEDEVTLSYAPGTLTFHVTGGAFDASASGCSAAAGEASCPVAGTLDSVLIAGLGGNDVLDGSGLPASASLVVLGGAGDDTVTGGEESDDTLIDGPGADLLHGRAGDDLLANNAGADRVLGEGGNDLFLSDAVCEGDLIEGGEGRDNASWAKFGEGVGANLGAGTAGRPGPGGAPQCAGGTLDSLQGVEDLEGSGSADALYGSSGPNQLLGHSGPDVYHAAAGDDSILANSADADPVIDCGEGSADVALVDHPQYGDAVPTGCETVQEADPNNFRVVAKLPEPPVQPTAPPAAPRRPSNRFAFGRVRLDRRKGIARLDVRFPTAGRLLVTGRRVRAIQRKVAGPGVVALVVRPKPMLNVLLKRRHRATVALQLAYTPTGGLARSRSKRLTLVRRG